MNNQLLDEITNEYLKKREPFKVGDGVNVHVKVREGGKERIQIFKGIVRNPKRNSSFKYF